MHNRIALILLLAFPAFGQLHRGNAGSTISGLHNHWAVPIDGGILWAWDMHNPAQASCTGANAVPNNATFTGSATTNLACGGSPTPTISSTGMTQASPGGFATASANVDLSSGWTLAYAPNPTNTSVADYWGIVNVNYATCSIVQYAQYIDTTASINFFYTSGGTQIFASSTTPIVTGSFQVVIQSFVSATPSSATIWYNKVKKAGTWTSGNGTTAIPAVQVETDVFGSHCAPSQSPIGTSGYQLAYNHAINSSASGFIYNAIYRAMQFRAITVTGN